MAEELARAFDFILRADMAGTRTAPFRWGLEVAMPELPLRHDSNYLLVDPAPPTSVDAAALAAEADRVQGAAGLRHRCLMFRDAEAALRYAPGFAALGWNPFHGVVMALHRPPERPADTARAVPTGPAALREARTREILGYPWGTPETARQLLAARDLIPVETRHFAVFEGGEPASWAELYLDGGVGQVEAVATVERFRGRGFAGAVVLRAAEEARRAGADLVFLCTDADDGPAGLYRRLGFDAIGRYTKFTRA